MRAERNYHRSFEVSELIWPPPQQWPTWVSAQTIRSSSPEGGRAQGRSGVLVQSGDSGRALLGLSRQGRISAHLPSSPLPGVSSQLHPRCLATGTSSSYPSSLGLTYGALPHFAGPSWVFGRPRAQFPASQVGGGVAVRELPKPGSG